MAKAMLKWSVQHPTHKPQPGDGLLHYAHSDLGTFEIFEAAKGSSFLLHFPKRARQPAELFHDLASAKTHAQIAFEGSQSK